MHGNECTFEDIVEHFKLRVSDGESSNDFRTFKEVSMPEFVAY